MKKYLTIILFLILIFFTSNVLQSCTNNKFKFFDDRPNDRIVNVIDLFSAEEKVVYDDISKLTKKQAFELSELILHVPYLERVYSSNTRSAKPFYLYKISEGRIEKSTKSNKNKFPIFFISEKELFKGKILQDSVYLFLNSSQGYQVLLKNMNINYNWVDKAPFSKSQDLF